MNSCLAGCPVAVNRVIQLANTFSSGLVNFCCFSRASTRDIPPFHCRRSDSCGTFISRAALPTDFHRPFLRPINAIAMFFSLSRVSGFRLRAIEEVNWWWTCLICRSPHYATTPITSPRTLRLSIKKILICRISFGFRQQKSLVVVRFSLSRHLDFSPLLYGLQKQQLSILSLG